MPCGVPTSTLTPLNLCAETLDGIRNHSWSRPAPHTPEGEVVSWADRIAYVCHDFEDAVAAGIVTPDACPPIVRDRCGERRSHQLGAFITAMIDAAGQTGRVGMTADAAEALAAFRKFNYDNVYLRPASQAQARSVISLLRALVEHYAAHPQLLPDVVDLDAGSAEALRDAVSYVGGMTDRFACRQAVALLGWDIGSTPARHRHPPLEHVGPSMRRYDTHGDPRRPGLRQQRRLLRRLPTSSSKATASSTSARHSTAMRRSTPQATPSTPGSSTATCTSWPTATSTR